MDDVTKTRACLFGGAMSDALGAQIEFWTRGRICARFPRGLTELPPHDGRAGRITDVTQMTLFTAEGLIRAVVRGQARHLRPRGRRASRAAPLVSQPGRCAADGGLRPGLDR